MYSQLIQCPRCGTEISHERVIGGAIVCSCGWTKSQRSEVSEKRAADKASALIVLFGGLIIASFLQSVNWEKYFFAIIPLKTKQILGSATQSELKEIAKICLERKKYECSEKARMQAARKDPRDFENLEALGQLQFKRERFEQALDTFTLYFSLKGQSPEAMYLYAQTFYKLKKLDQAERYFELTLDQKQEILQVTVIKNYVQLLRDRNKLAKARDVILKYQKLSANGPEFMKPELAEINTKLGQYKTAGT